MKCWKCSTSFDLAKYKIGFRDLCPTCHYDQHVCKNCRYHTIGKPNNCSVPGTEYIRNPEAANLCEEFKIKLSESSKENKSIFNSLFKDKEP